MISLNPEYGASEVVTFKLINLLLFIFPFNIFLIIFADGP